MEHLRLQGLEGSEARSNNDVRPPLADQALPSVLSLPSVLPLPIVLPANAATVEKDLA